MDDDEFLDDLEGEADPSDRWEDMVALRSVAEELETYADTIAEAGGDDLAFLTGYVAGRLRRIVRESGEDMGEGAE